MESRTVNRMGLASPGIMLELTLPRLEFNLLTHLPE